VSSYRRMRRQARHARRHGMQPMMVINSGDQAPDSAALIVIRAAWRYRSELTPLYLAAVLLVSGWWLHATHPRWWAYLFGIAASAAWALAIFGAKAGLPALAERLYAAAVTLVAGCWLAAVDAAGPVTFPLPQALVVGGTVLAVPWWANRRRRAKVRVERTIAIWPDIAKDIGLTGSQILSATVDLWGWRARLGLARGQTITDVMAKVPAIESGFGAHRNAIRVHPTPDDLANRCELRVLDRDPHAGAIPWRGPSVTSITEPIDLARVSNDHGLVTPGRSRV
jgi:hypothetical protein